MSSRNTAIVSVLVLVSSLAGAWDVAAATCVPNSAAMPGVADPHDAISEEAGRAYAIAEDARAKLEEDGAELRLEAALEEASALDATPERLRVELYVARSWMLWSSLADEPEIGARGLRAATLLADIATRSREAGAMEVLSRAQGYRAELYEGAGRLAEALTLADAALTAAAAIDAPQLRGRWLGLLGRLSSELGREDEALTHFLAARGPLIEARARLEPRVFLELAEPIYLSLIDLLLREGGEARLREAQEMLEELKTAELRDYFHDECLTAQTQRATSEVAGAVVLYPVLLSDRVELLVNRQGVMTRAVSPATREQVEDAATRFGKALRDVTTRRYRAPAEQLYEWLVQPVEREWADGDTTLVFVPSGALFQIPIAALVDPRSGEFLVEQVPVAVTPSLSLTDPRPIDRTRIELLAAGLEGSVDGYPELPGVADEIAAVRESFPGTRVLGEGFSRKGLERELAARPFGIVHVASHGQFSSESGESFLLAQDGRISMDALADLIGRTRFRTDRPLQLLTLSACSTAEGDARAALGLAGVAIQSGARSALATLWRVNDIATARLIAEFYSQLSKPGVSRARALQHAQRELISERAFRHPNYWGAFLLINSWL